MEKLVHSCRMVAAIVLMLLVAQLAQAQPVSSGTGGQGAPPPGNQPGNAPVANAGGTAAVGVFWPTGQRATSVVLLEKFSPNPVWLNKPYEYQLRVTNLTNQTLMNTVLIERTAEGFTLDGTNPKAQQLPDGKLQWPLGDLAPGDNRVVRLHGTATRVGKLENCAVVRYDVGTCLAIDVVQPELKLAKTSPAEVMQCDPINIQLTVSNTGSGAAENVVITDQLPDGMVTLDGQRAVKIPVGTLPAGTSRQATIVAKATRTGTYNNQATATAEGGLTASANSTTRVTKPVLTITKTGPELRFMSRPIEYVLTVTNTGDAVARNAVLVDQVPNTLRFLKASDNGVLAGNIVTWQLGDLQPKQARTVNLVLTGTQIAEVENVGRASAYCADDVMATVKTRIAGIPAILLEVIDESDPIEVGQTVTYVIRVTNQGSLAGTNIKIDAQLEEQAEFVSAEGATPGTGAGKKISFAPVASLAPKAQAVWKVVVRAIGEGDVRFHLQMKSDQIDRTVDETEATNFYK